MDLGVSLDLDEPLNSEGIGILMILVEWLVRKKICYKKNNVFKFERK